MWNVYLTFIQLYLFGGRARNRKDKSLHHSMDSLEFLWNDKFNVNILLLAKRKKMHPFLIPCLGFRIVIIIPFLAFFGLSINFNLYCLNFCIGSTFILRLCGSIIPFSLILASPRRAALYRLMEVTTSFQASIVFNVAISFLVALCSFEKASNL